MPRIKYLRYVRLGNETFLVIFKTQWTSITRYERDECINISPFPFGDGLGSFQNETFRNGINSESHGKFVHSPQLLLLDLSRYAVTPFTLMLTSFYASGSFGVDSA
mgnify:CR=1 FL=1